MNKTKKTRKSRFNKGDKAVLTKKCNGFRCGETVKVENPYKEGKLHKIEVSNGDWKKEVPIKYLDDVD